MGRQDAKKIVSCVSCRYRWNWKSRTFCFNCNATIAPIEMPWRDVAQGVWAQGGCGTQGAQRPPAVPPGEWQWSPKPQSLSGHRGSTPPTRGAPAGEDGLATVDLLAQLKQRLAGSAAAQELQALESAIGPQAPPKEAKPARPPLLEAQVSAKGVACRRAEAHLEQCVAKEDDAKAWYEECREATALAAQSAVQANLEWQAELELDRAGGARPPSSAAGASAAAPTGRRHVDIIDGDLLDLSDLQVEDQDKQRCQELKSNMGKEIRAAILAAIGPSAEKIQSLRQPRLREARAALGPRLPRSMMALLLLLGSLLPTALAGARQLPPQPPPAELPLRARPA
ncbi:unnamed protein product, partial [Prorocentrum cordatum]